MPANGPPIAKTIAPVAVVSSKRGDEVAVSALAKSYSAVSFRAIRKNRDLCVLFSDVLVGFAFRGC
jgi:hypothetical protein